MKMGDTHFFTIVTALLLIRITFQTEYYECPQKCVCLKKYVDCSGKNLASVPNIPMWVEQLDLNFNKLSKDVTAGFERLAYLRILRLDKNALTHIPDFLSSNEIQDVSLNKNHIESIDAGRFPVNCSIKVLSLNNNRIKSIDENALVNLTNLVSLKLNKNEIVSLPNQLFSNQSNLKVLELNHNKLRVINGLVFKGLSNLSILRIKYNNIENIMDGAFFGFKSVNLLHLDHNGIKNISKGWTYGLESLATLSMSNNLISHIDMGSWEQCSKLENLNLSHNSLFEIEGRTLQHLVNLQTLKLSNNNISSISQEAFSHMTKLQILYLNNNKISWTVEDMSGPFSKLQSLKIFNLSNNHIKSIGSKAFGGLNNVVELDLRNNNITSIQQHAFDSMSKLKKFYLNSNSLLCDCNLLWIVKWIKDKVDHRSVRATCAYPSEVRGFAISKLKEDNCGDNSPKPKITEHPKPHHAIKNRSDNLVCSATSNPFSNITFLWRKNNGNISNPMVYENVTVSVKGHIATSILILPNVAYADAGRYQCVVSNKFGTTYSNKATVNIVTYPHFRVKPTNVTVKTGELVTLNCAATGDPSPEISWKKDGGVDFPAARERRMNVIPNDPRFFIVNAKPADMGIYSCAAKNDAGTILANATVTVLQEPSFIRVMENKEVVSGESTVLECTVTGSPKPVLKWYKDGSIVVPTKRHYFLNDNQYLVTINTESEDAGQYECEITNELGTKKEMFEVKVLPPVAIMVKEEDMTGIIIITVVCCAVGTSIIWVVIIYHTRRRMAGAVRQYPAESVKMTQVVHSDSDSPHMFPDNLSEHSSCKDSGTGDSAKQTSFDGVPTDKSDQVHFESAVCRSYSPVQEAHKLLPSSFKPSIQVCVNTCVTPATYSFSSHSSNV